MSRMAQETQRLVESIKPTREKKRPTMKVSDDADGAVEIDVQTEAVESGGEQNDMAQNKTAKASTKAKMKKVTAKVKAVVKTMKKTAKRVKREGGGRVEKTYRLVKEIPEMREGSTGLQILKLIGKSDGKATTKSLQAVLKKCPSPTLRFYLGKFQRDKVVASK